jgi:hypothetical protein
VSTVDRVPLCLDCWKVRHPGREPSRVVGEAVSTERCHLCDDETRSGIWVLRKDVAPWRTGKPPEEVTLTGKCFAWFGDAPSLIELPGAGMALAVFTTVEKLAAMVEAVALPCDSIKQITDTWEFLNSVPPEVLVVIDPWRTPQGTTRYMEVKRD